MTNREALEVSSTMNSPSTLDVALETERLLESLDFLEAVIGAVP